MVYNVNGFRGDITDMAKSYSQGSCLVLLLSKANNIFVGYFDPVKIFIGTVV